MKKERLKGHGPSAYDMNMALFGQGDPDVPILTGDQRSDVFQQATPTSPSIQGKIMIVGTGGELESEKGFKNLWMGKP